MTIEERITELTKRLPEWHFRRYGNSESVACYPPRRPFNLGRDWYELAEHAPIEAVCGPLFTIRELHCEKQPTTDHTNTDPLPM